MTGVTGKVVKQRVIEWSRGEKTENEFYKTLREILIHEIITEKNIFCVKN